MDMLVKDPWLNDMDLVTAESSRSSIATSIDSSTASMNLSQPYVEPERILDDPQRVKTLNDLGYDDEAIKTSLTNNTFDEIHATYNLLEIKKSVDQQREVERQ